MSDLISNINNNYIGGDILDGQWTEVSPDALYLYSGDIGVYTSSSSVKIMSLDGILPNDGYAYLCQIRLSSATGTSSGNILQTYIISGSLEYKYSGNNNLTFSSLPVTLPMGVRTRTANSRIAAGWMFVPVYPEDRHITVINTNQANNTNFPFGVALFRFRRLGTNK